MIVLYIVILIYFNFNITSIVNVFMLSIEKKKSNLGQKSISFMGPPIWNKLSNDLKILNTTTSFTHNYKKLILKKLA